MAWCKVCAGTGKISCGICWGGQSKPVCPDCLGSGSIEQDNGMTTCARCHGIGKITPQSCPTCGNSHTCSVCGGSGDV